MVYYNVAAKKILREVKLSKEGPVRSIQMLRIYDGSETLTLNYRDGSNLIIDLDQEVVVAKMESRGPTRVVGQAWLGGEGP